MRAIKKRLDVLLVERGLFPTRAKAQAAILAGNIRLPKHLTPKAGLQLRADAAIEVLPDACPYVSRGGLKLAAALEGFHIDVQGRVALDVGSSTGGFTDCLLRHGAARVYAVDVGIKQLDASLRMDSRVSAMEETHARDLRPEMFSPPPDLAVIDVSFISLTRVLANVVRCLGCRPNHTAGFPAAAPASDSWDLLTLVKPQFELGPRKAPRGIVREPAHWEEAITRVRQAAQALGLREINRMESPLRGAKGNHEFFLHWRG